MGEPINGVAIIRRSYARPSVALQIEGGCYQLCKQARIRVLCAGAEPAEICAQSIREQLPSRTKEIKDHPNKVIYTISIGAYQ